MATETTLKTVKARVDENSPQAECKLTIKWDDAAAERAFATRGVVIAAQAMMRASGTIPADLTVSVSELSKRERGGFAMKPSAANANRLMAKLDDTQYADALRQIGIGEGEIKRLVAARAKLATATPTAPVGTAAKVAAKKPGPVAVVKK